MVFKIDMAKPTIFRYLFQALCAVCVICMVGYWFYKFDVEDRDIGVVDYIAFEDDSRIPYPVASLCFEDPFYEDKLSEIDPAINITHYLEYLKGDVFEERLTHVDYSDVTIDLDEYLSDTGVTLQNGTYMEGGEIATFSQKVNFNGISEWGWFYKCFELSLNMANPETVRESHVIYDMTELLSDSSNWPVYIDLYIHYPGQFLLAPNDFTLLAIESSSKSLEVQIDDIEILESRSSRRRRCTVYDDKVSFDDMVREEHIIKNGCTLPYFKSHANFPKCDTGEKIKNSTFNRQNVRTKYYPASCQRLSKISYKTDWRDSSYFDLSENKSEIGIIYPQYFRTIKLSKEVDVHSLIGNVGGYVGLFLGNHIRKDI